MLVDLQITATDLALSQSASAFIVEGRSRFRTVDCFDFVPSDYELLWRTLDGLGRGRFCEWGSGFGIATGLAEMLGFQASGIEISPQVADASRQLLSDFGLTARIETGDYLELAGEADVYFVYCWPSKIMATEARFETVAPPGAKLLICYGQSDIRCKVRGE